MSQSKIVCTHMVAGDTVKKYWFNEVTKLKYYSNTEMDELSRKTIERALIQKYKPKYNDGN